MDVRLKYAGLVALLAMPLMGMSCSGMKYDTRVQCSSGQGCEVEGQIHGSLPLAPGEAGKGLPYALAGTLDAGAYSIDISDSTVKVPSSGLVTITLTESSSGIKVASKVFGWTLRGTKIVLSDPTSVNTWAMENAGAADTVDYALHRFTPTEQDGWNTLAVAGEYLGEVRTYATTSWRGQVCPQSVRANHRGAKGVRHCP